MPVLPGWHFFDRLLDLLITIPYTLATIMVITCNCGVDLAARNLGAAAALIEPS
jgi:ABC-type sulfate transport system permease component